MHLLRCVRRAVRLAALLAGVGATALLGSPASATAGPTATVPAQYPGYPWGGAPGWPPGVSSPSWPSPYAGSPGYPYYRRGAYYGSAYGPPYPISPSPGAYYSDTYGPAYPLYPSAGGVVFGYAD